MTATLHQFTILVKETRKAQKKYFAYREARQEKEELLQASIKAEKESDRYSVLIDQAELLVKEYQAMRRLQVQFFRLQYGDPKRKKVMLDSKTAESSVDKLLKVQAVTQSQLF